MPMRSQGYCGDGRGLSGLHWVCFNGEEISSLSYSIVFPYFFALITEGCVLTLLAILWNSAFKWVYLSFSHLLFCIPILLQCMKVKSESEVAQSCPTLSDPKDCSLPGSSVHGIFQA